MEKIEEEIRKEFERLKEENTQLELSKFDKMIEGDLKKSVKRALREGVFNGFEQLD